MLSMSENLMQGFPVTQHPEAAAFGLALWVGFFLVAAVGVCTSLPFNLPLIALRIMTNNDKFVSCHYKSKKSDRR